MAYETSAIFTITCFIFQENEMPSGWIPDQSAALPSSLGLTLGVNEDGRLEIYTFDSKSILWHKWQKWDATQTTIAGWSDWAPLAQTEDTDFIAVTQHGFYGIYTGLTAVGGECLELVTQLGYGVQQLSANGV